MGIEPGTLVAQRYRVRRPLGKGGMGEVFAAENTRTGRNVLRAEAKTKASAIERFRREARAAGSIHSDQVTQVLDVEDDPQHGIVLVFELLDGESLVERLKRTGPIAFVELWGIVEQVWMGLADAHAVGVVHRDLKPSNVFLLRGSGGGGCRVKILDFGISKLPKELTTQSLTELGQSLGTFSFMPPEQMGKAKMVDHRADVYACTTLVYQALSGQLPYVSKNILEMMELKSTTEPRTLAEAMGGPVAPELEQFITGGLHRDPDQRFGSAQIALEAWRKLRPAGAISAADGSGSDRDWAYARAPASRPSPPELPEVTEVTDVMPEAAPTVPRAEAAPSSTPRPASDQAPAAAQAGSPSEGPVAPEPAVPSDLLAPPAAQAEPQRFPHPAGPPPPPYEAVGGPGQRPADQDSGAPSGNNSPPPWATGPGAGHGWPAWPNAAHGPSYPEGGAPRRSGWMILGLVVAVVGLMLLGFALVALLLRVV